MSVASRAKRVTTNTLQEMKGNGEKIAMLTAYDFSLARLVDASGIDVILVGDSASNVMAGHETTVPITLDQMIYHAQSVVRAVQRALVVVDMPFGTYQSDSNNALKSAIRIMKETGGHAVKLEGGAEVLSSIRKIIDAGIPVMGHLGLTPQAVHRLGYRRQATDAISQERLVDQARTLEQKGCFSLVLEHVPAELACRVQQALTIPVIGIGAGDGCDGQVRVTADLLGLTAKQPPFSPALVDGRRLFIDALKGWVQQTRNNTLPTTESPQSAPDC